MFTALLNALGMAFAMGWEILWPLVLGFALSAVISGNRLAPGDEPPTRRQLATLWGPIVGPLVAIISFVCSVGNIPLAAVLWNCGTSFGGVLAFILADLIVLPILNIYRKYYGLEMAAFLLVTFYVAMDGRCPCCRRIVWSPWSDSPRASGPRRRSFRHVELHDMAQYWISSPRGFSGAAVRHDRRHRNAADDE